MVLDRLLFASHIDNLNGAKPVTIKFNSDEPKVKFNRIKYTCIVCDMQFTGCSPLVDWHLAVCRRTIPMVYTVRGLAATQAMVRGFNVHLSEPLN